MNDPTKCFKIRDKRNGEFLLKAGTLDTNKTGKIFNTITGCKAFMTQAAHFDWNDRFDMDNYEIIEYELIKKKYYSNIRKI